VVADIHDVSSVIEAIRTYQPVGLMHFAAFAYVGESVADPQKYHENNVIGTLALLNAARQTGLRNFVFSSSCAVYGAPEVERISEEVLPQPVNPYGTSKRACEMMLSDFVAAYGFNAISLRYFNASGAHPTAGIGEDRIIETRLIPRAILSLLGQVDDFAVFGNDFKTPDGTAIRDYIHVVDLARAHVLALDHLLAGKAGGTFNLGTGRGYSVNEVVNAIAEVSGRLMPDVKGARRPGDPARLVADASLAQRVLGFITQRSSLQQIVADAWAWHTSGQTRYDHKRKRAA